MTATTNECDKTEAPEKALDFWHSPEIDKIGGALAKAQGEIEGAEKGATNPHFRSKYADLASIWDACRKPLSKNEIAVVQLPSGRSVTTMLVHSSGQFFACRLGMTPRDDTPQSIGSVITYARRYALAAMTGVAPEDDDGNAASGRGGRPERDQDDPRPNGPVVSMPRGKPEQFQSSVDQRSSATKGNVEQMWRQMTDIKSSLAVFAKLKASLAAVLGEEGDKAYYRVLGSHGVEHANEFRKPEEARVAAKEMLDLVQGGGPEGFGV